MCLLAPIDTHVHLRGTERAEPFTPWALDDAYAVGLAGLCEMPNRTPPILSIQDSHARTSEVLAHFNLNRSTIPPLAVSIPPPVHHAHVGLTTLSPQVTAFLDSAVALDDPPSCKIFFAQSTLSMGIIDSDYQDWLWRQFAQANYHGVVLGHFEDESTFATHEATALSLLAASLQLPHLNALAHSVRRNLNSELVQVERQYRFARNHLFQGTFYVCHVSNPATVDFLVSERKRNPSFTIVMEASFHHLLLNTSDYITHATRIQMNPPLRPAHIQVALLDRCLAGAIDVLGSDHAPHPLRAKEGPYPSSGIPSLPFWPMGLRLLLKAGLPIPVLNQMIFHTPNRLFFGGTLSPRPYTFPIYSISLWDKYGYNPFSRVGI